VPSRLLDLSAIYEELRVFIDTHLSDFPESRIVSAYFVQRAQHDLAVRQDLLPLLVYQAVSDRSPSKMMPLLAAWALHLDACHLLDDAQDNKRFENTNVGIVALGAGQVALAELETTEEVLRDLLGALGRVVTLAAGAQNSELYRSATRSRTDYFRVVGGKAAAIIAAGAWMGGRFATDKDEILSLLREFGLALGMAIQIGDDCMDLADDLVQGIYTLPVIEGLALTGHPDHPTLKRLVSQTGMSPENARLAVDILERMGAIATSKRVVRAYQVQAAAVFEVIPGLRPYFAQYVAAKP